MLGQTDNLVVIFFILSYDTYVQFHINVCLFQPFQGFHAQGVSLRIVAQASVSFSAVSIQGDVYPPRLVGLQDAYHFVVDECAVRIESQDESHFAQPGVQLLEVWVEHRFTSGEEDEECTHVLKLFCPVEPLLQRR